MKAHITRIAILASTYAALTGLLVVGFVLAQEAEAPQLPKQPVHKPSMVRLEAAVAAIEVAAKAVEAGQTQTAQAELTKAKHQILAAHRTLAGVEIVNVRCPMMGNKINPATVTKDLTRTHKGEKVAFCCAACPVQWDKLSDADKDAKLAKVLPDNPAKPLKCGCYEVCRCKKQ